MLSWVVHEKKFYNLGARLYYVGKRTPGYMRPAKIQTSLRMRGIFTERSWIAKDAKFRYADNEDSDQTARMRRLIWVFDLRTCRKYVFSRCGS